MRSPYSLLLDTGVLQGESFVADLTRQAAQWHRSVRFTGGFWIGQFFLMGAIDDLMVPYRSWLGYQLRERTAGGVTWEGMVYDMTMRHAGESRRRSLDDVANAVKATYKGTDYAGTNVLQNPYFEDVGGGLFTFDKWVDREGSGGDVFDETVLFYQGAHACGITDCSNPPDGSTPYTFCRQGVSLTPGGDYQVSFYTRGDGTHAGRWALRDPHASVWLVAPVSTGVTGTTYTQVTQSFTAPADGDVILFFFGPDSDGDTAYFDAAAIQERVEVTAETSWQTNDTSISRYGRIEERIYLDQQPQATAENMRDKVLGEKGWPWERPVGSHEGPPVLDVTVCGYIFSSAFRFLTASTDAEDDLDAWLLEVLAADCDFLEAGEIAANTLQVSKQPSIRERAWDVLKSLADIGGDDGSGNVVPWRLWVGPGRLLHFKPLDVSPVYYASQGALYDGLGQNQRQVSSWAVRPGVVRNMDWPAGAPMPGSPFEDARDSLMAEVEVFDDGRIVRSSAETMTEASLTSAQIAWVEEMERSKK